MEGFLQEIMPAILQLASMVVLGLIGMATNAVKTWAEEKGAMEKLVKYEYLADIAVKAAEQVYQKEDGPQKLASAKEIFLDSIPEKSNITLVQLDGFLEAAVKRLKDEWV